MKPEAVTFPQLQRYFARVVYVRPWFGVQIYSRFKLLLQIAAITASAYVTASLIAKVINESISPLNCSTSLHELQDGAGIAHRFSNRTFSLPTGEVYFSPTGQRHVDMLVKQYNFTTGRFDVGWFEEYRYEIYLWRTNGCLLVLTAERPSIRTQIK